METENKDCAEFEKGSLLNAAVENKAQPRPKDLKTLTQWVIWLFYIGILVDATSVTSELLTLQLLNDFKNGVFASQALADAAGAANDRREQLIALLLLTVGAISGFLILKWIYRANYNCHQLGAEGMKYTPGWSIGWWFIPLFNFWKPYAITKEIWRVSVDPKNWKAVHIPAIFGWWWFLEIIRITPNSISRISYQMAVDTAERTPGNVEAIRYLYSTSSIFSLVGAILGIPLGFAWILVIKKIYEAQVQSAPSDAYKEENDALRKIRDDLLKEKERLTAEREIEKLKAEIEALRNS